MALAVRAIPSKHRSSWPKSGMTEQRAAAAVLGCTDITFLGYPDGRVEPTLALRWDIARVIRKVRPDVVITQDPLFRYGPSYINHPDHRAVADATLRSDHADGQYLVGSA